MPLIFDGVCLEFRGNYLLKAFASKFNKQILDMKITKFLPLESRGTLYNSEGANLIMPPERESVPEWT